MIEAGKRNIANACTVTTKIFPWKSNIERREKSREKQREAERSRERDRV